MNRKKMPKLENLFLKYKFLKCEEKLAFFKITADDFIAKIMQSPSTIVE